MKTIGDASLMKVFRFLLKELKRKTEDGLYPVFPPEKIEILGNGKILHETKNGVTDLRECLRQLGVTMYHLAVGESEHNKTSYQIDGYLNRPLDSELWPVLALLLSGKAFSIPQIEDAISRKKKVIEYFRTTAISAGAIIQQNFMDSARKLILLPGALPGKVAAVARRNWSMILSRSAIVLVLASVVEIIWYWMFNWPFSYGGGIFVNSALFVAGFIAIYNATFDSGVSHSTRNVMGYLFLPLVIGLMFVYAATSFVVFLPIKEVQTPVKDYSILIGRKSGDFIGRLPLNADDWQFIWKPQADIWSINHLKYKVVPGIPLKHYFERTYTFKDGSAAYDFPARIYYRIKADRREEYVGAWKKWKNAENMESALIWGINNKTVPVMNIRFHEILESFDKNRTADLLFNASLINQKKKNLTILSFTHSEQSS